jgi:hypothetical protein
MYFPFIAFIVVAVIVLIPIVISTQLFRISRRLQSQDGRLERIERDQKQILNAIKEKSLAEPVATVQPVTAASVSTSAGATGESTIGKAGFRRSISCHRSGRYPTATIRRDASTIRC